MFITNIQRFSLEDGPGIRTTVFFAGCNMRCLWCHNPETFERIMLGYDPNKCVGCGQCTEVCKTDAHIFSKGVYHIDWNKCKRCLKCVEVCRNGALFLNSKEISADELLQEIEKDMRFYMKSSGGVTFSGGEPLLQVDGLREILKKCKKKKIHTVVETAGDYSFEILEPLLDYIDLIVMDCKAYSAELHKKCTGYSNEHIFDNIQKLSGIGKDIWIRIPVVWDINITFEEIEKIAEFLKGKQVNKVELLSYHKMGISKYKTYGKNYLLQTAKIPDEGQINRCYDILKKYQLPV